MKYHKHKTKRNLHCNDRSWQSETETYVAEILKNKIYCDKFIYLFKIKCFLVDLYDAQYKRLNEGHAWQWINWLLPWHFLCFVKFFFIWGSFFWFTSFWGCSLEFLSIITASVYWGEVFDLKVPSLLLLHTKLS